GRRRALWVSENRSLLRDAVRDWTALGGPAEYLFDLGACKGAISRAEGVCFASYDTLKGKPREKDGATTGIDRLEQVVAWLAGSGEATDFDGVIVFDESHNMASAIDRQGSRGVQKASQRALVGVELQARLPNARVVYASATGATEVANLAYAARLGLWGRGTPFPTVESFVEKVSAGGIAAMELVAKDLKSMGLYLARSVSYDGVDYRTLVHELEPHQATTYDRCAEAWQVVLRNLQAALEVTNADKCARARATAYSQFWGCHQRFFLHLLVAMSAPSLIRDMEARLGAGESCVVQLVSTMEAATERAYAKAVASGDDLQDLDVTPRDQLLQFVEASFPTTLYEEYKDDDGRVRSRPVKNVAGDFVQSPEAVAARDRLMLEVGAARVPHGVLDQIVAHFGPEAVAEVTGRSRRFVAKTVDGVEQVVEERRTRRTCDAEADEFMAGRRRVLVFSQAGGTGRSYHADLAADNQQRRVLYCVEPGWSSARCVQGMGRVHRANQACPPELVLVTTNLKAQRRFLSTIARRLDQLGALTKGQRQTASLGLLSSEFNLETSLSRASLHNWFVDLYRGSGRAAAAGVTPSLVEEQMGIRVLDADGQLNVGAIPEVPKFLNRLLSLRTRDMDAVFDSWYAYLEEATESAREAGTLDVGVETIQALRTVKTAERHVYRHPRSGATTQVVTLELTRRTEIADWDEAWRWAKEAQGLGTWMGFVVNRRSGQPYALVRAGSRTTTTGRVVARLRRVGVRSNRLMDETDLNPRAGDGGHQPIPTDEARRLWDAGVRAAPEFTTEAVHLVTGTILPIWDRIAGHPRIYRAQTDAAGPHGPAGERMIGRAVAPEHLSATLKALGASGDRVEITPEALAERLMAGAEADLANGWRLQRRRAAGEHRIELVGPDLSAMRELEADGVFAEVHAFRTRFFVPVGARAAAVLRAVTEHRPVVEVRDPARGRSLRRAA
ncbi:MAG: strawberry notch C-terminal domain-containing protein, partial [Bacteroidota bacterium]